jgi:hypothetical protein
MIYKIIRVFLYVERAQSLNIINKITILMNYGFY